MPSNAEIAREKLGDWFDKLPGEDLGKEHFEALIDLVIAALNDKDARLAEVRAALKSVVGGLKAADQMLHDLLPQAGPFKRIEARINAAEAILSALADAGAGSTAAPRSAPPPPEHGDE